MTDSEADKMAAGERLFHTVEHGDLEDLRSIFADGAMVWHNTDEALTDVETTIRNLRAIRESATVFHYDAIRREPTTSGFVQQHILIVELPDGRTIRDLCCCLCRSEEHTSELQSLLRTSVSVFCLKK